MLLLLLRDNHTASYPGGGSSYTRVCGVLDSLTSVLGGAKPLFYLTLGHLIIQLYKIINYLPAILFYISLSSSLVCTVNPKLDLSGSGSRDNEISIDFISSGSYFIPRWSKSYNCFQNVVLLFQFHLHQRLAVERKPFFSLVVLNTSTLIQAYQS